MLVFFKKITYKINKLYVKLASFITSVVFKYTVTFVFIIFGIGAYILLSHFSNHQDFFLNHPLYSNQKHTDSNFIANTIILLISMFIIFIILISYIINKLKTNNKKSSNYLRQIKKINSKLAKEIKNKNKIADELITINKKHWEMAFLDTLTGLPNRRLLEDRIKKSISKAIRDNEKIGLLFLDLDGFKNINDTLGHAAGDKLLKILSKKIKNTVRQVDTVARLGGDEFIVIADNLKNPKELSKVAHKILKIIREPVIINKIEVFTSVSIGMVIFPDDAKNLQDLIMKADLSMYRAKELGKNKYCYYSDDLQKDANLHFVITADINKALNSKELEVFYQPQIDIINNKIIGAEALIRWKHKRIGFINPERIISVSEGLGLIHELDHYVLKEACNSYIEWTKYLNYSIRLSLNISLSEIYSHNFIENIVEEAKKYGVDTSCLELELTESIIIKDLQRSQEVLKNIHDHKIRLAIDDFGTGYSTFKYLSLFPISTIKIDKSFVNNFLEEEQSLFIIKAILNLSDLLNVSVIAEGVETKAQLDKLRELGCQYCQGYYFSEPVSQSEFLKFIQDYNKQHE